ncbi:hypothetical protein R6Q57_008001 [Mikania cordata]
MPRQAVLVRRPSFGLLKLVYRDGGRHSTPRRRRPAGATLRSRDTCPIAAPVAAVRARVGDGDEVQAHIADEHGDATLYRLGVLADAGEAVRARAILVEDTPWTRLFEIAGLPTHRLITVEFLSTFRYRAHQEAVREQDDEELPLDIEFSLCGQHFEISIERFVVQLGIYYETETVCDDFTQGLTQGEEGVMRAWWAQIYDTPFTGPRVRATMIRDPLIRYIHRCIVTTISGRGQSQEWVTKTDLFYLHSLIAGRPCNLARSFALYHASFYHRQERDTLWGGAFVTHIARSRDIVDMLEDLLAIEPRKLDRRTIITMKLVADIPGLGLRFIGSDGRPFQDAQVVIVPEQQQPQDDGAMPDPEPIWEKPV